MKIYIDKKHLYKKMILGLLFSLVTLGWMAYMDTKFLYSSIFTFLFCIPVFWLITVKKGVSQNIELCSDLIIFNFVTGSSGLKINDKSMPSIISKRGCWQIKEPTSGSVIKVQKGAFPRLKSDIEQFYN